MKYNLPKGESEILPNLLGLSTKQEIAEAEFEGFLEAEIRFTESLAGDTRFTVRYILDLHRAALRHLYEFAGSLRTVNISKDGFMFPAAKFLPKAMERFESEILQSLSNDHSSSEELIRDVAIVHGELLFIHPFREGNGRTARVLANLMVRKQGFDPLRFEKISDGRFDEYVRAV